MNILLNNSKIIDYEKSIKEDFLKLETMDVRYGEINYFIDLVKEKLIYQNMCMEKPKIIAIGTSIPEEIIYASGNTPYWIMGGSLSTIGWSDNLVPRDTDSISRSLLGVLLNDNFEMAKKSLIIIPVMSDSFRKITYLLKNEGYNIHNVYIPAIKTDFTLDEWNRQIDECIQAIEKYTKKFITKKALKNAHIKVSNAKRQIQNFLKLTEDNINISSIHRTLIIYSYYCIQDIEEWTNQLKKLNDKIMNDKLILNGKEYRGNVIVIGSPIYYPNFKVPFLLEDVKLNMVGIFDYSTQKLSIPPGESSSEHINNCFLYDTSSSYANNYTMYTYIENLIKDGTTKVDGVVYHIIKGQLDFDFELEKFEKLFAQYDIPVFRLETDYNYQDIEQLRIRMEAFSEVLEQKNITKEKKL